MKLASYIGTRSGIMGIGNYLIRLRVRGKESHSEIMFEPGDGVDEFMPDGTCQPDADGALWHASSVGLEKIPDWSPRRAGHLGGVRFKRIVPDDKWVHDSVNADPKLVARMANLDQGKLYDWQAIITFIFWIMPQKMNRGMCNEVIGGWIGIDPNEAYLFDPHTLRVAVRGLSGISDASN